MVRQTLYDPKAFRPNRQAVPTPAPGARAMHVQHVGGQPGTSTGAIAGTTERFCVCSTASRHGRVPVVPGRALSRGDHMSRFLRYAPRLAAAASTVALVAGFAPAATA